MCITSADGEMEREKQPYSSTYLLRRKLFSPSENGSSTNLLHVTSNK